MVSLSLLALSMALFTMRALAFSLPSILLSQFTRASPAWISPEYDVSGTILDPDHNKLGAVASESSICTNIGIDMLKAGGNAADSLVATVFCVGVIGMYHRYDRVWKLDRKLLTLIAVLVEAASCKHTNG